jgi:hypothetical protein
MNSIRNLIAAVLIAFTLAGCGSDSSCITKVLEQCSQISHRAAAYNNSPGAQANYIAAEFQKIDVSGCPEDFRMAFQSHIFAWQQAAPALGNNNLGTAFLEGVVSGLADDPRFIGQAGQQAGYAGQQINATYYQLTQIAAKYGARIPRSVAGE